MSYVSYKEALDFGFTLIVESDNDPLNPRKDYDPVTTISCAHHRYDLSDDDAVKYDEEFFHRLLNEIGVDTVCPHCEYGTIIGDEDCSFCDGSGCDSCDYSGFISYETECDHCEGTGELTREQAEIEARKHYYIQALYLYDHSGITIRSHPFPCTWDSGHVGYQYVLKSRAISEWGQYHLHSESRKIVQGGPRTDADFYELMDHEVKAFDDYLTGNCWYFTIQDDKGNDVESCGGFLGDVNDCIEEARDTAKYIIRMETAHRTKEAQERTYWEARDVVTVGD